MKNQKIFEIKNRTQLTKPLGAAIAVLRGKLIAINAHSKKLERFQKNNQSCMFRKENQIKPKQQMEGHKIRAEINKIEFRITIEKIMKLSFPKR